MSVVEPPVWLKIMENGATGEARTKAFLVDRFWVLERSVDIDGADYLIQPRVLTSRFTDRKPPNIGVVQAKYFQDRRTVHHIPHKYVVDSDGNPLRGFFLVLHLGREDEASMYMLSSADIVATLDQTSEDPSKFVVGTKALDNKFLVSSKSFALDRIAHELQVRTAAESFIFLDRINIPFRRITKDNIEHSYALPIPNTQTDIPKAYFEYRDSLRSLTYEIEEALGLIDDILQTPDPRVAFEKLDKLCEYRGGSGYTDGLIFSGYKCDLDWPYLTDALDEHDERQAALERKGYLPSYVKLSKIVQDKINKELSKFANKAEDGQYIWAGMNYDSRTLEFKSIEIKLVSERDYNSEAKIQKVSPIYSIGTRPVDVESSASNLWHGLMTYVLKEVCPEFGEAEGIG